MVLIPWDELNLDAICHLQEIADLVLRIPCVLNITDITREWNIAHLSKSTATNLSCILADVLVKKIFIDQFLNVLAELYFGQSSIARLGITWQCELLSKKDLHGALCLCFEV